MTRPGAPERPRPRNPSHSARESDAQRGPLQGADRQTHLELQQARLAQRHAKILRQTTAAERPKNAWRYFVEQFGWRAYALPLLVIITVWALFTTNTGSVRSTITSAAAAPTKTVTVPPTAAATGQLQPDSPGVHADNEALASDALPAGAPYTVQGKGTFHTLAGTTGVFGAGPLRRFSVEAEDGISAAEQRNFADTVVATLSDSHSWIGGKDVSLQRVDSGPVDFHVMLTSSMRVRQLCGYNIQIETSCFDVSGLPSQPSHVNNVVLNVARWVRGDVVYLGASNLGQYRQYMVNHETGHSLGHNHAHQCLANGLAPVMMQQTIGLKTASGQVCQPNQWPYPDGATDAPGAEQSPDSGADEAFVKLNS